MRRITCFVLILIFAITLQTYVSAVVGDPGSIIINGIDIGYKNGDYFTKDGGPCTCHNGEIDCICSEDENCNCMRYWYTGDAETCIVDLQAVQCMGFARYCQWAVYGTHEAMQPQLFETSCVEIPAGNCTAEWLKETLSACAPATHIRTGDNTHSLCIISADSNGLVITECNYDCHCRIRVIERTWDDFADYLQQRGGIFYVKSIREYELFVEQEEVPAVLPPINAGSAFGQYSMSNQEEWDKNIETKEVPEQIISIQKDQCSVLPK